MLYEISYRADVSELFSERRESSSARVPTPQPGTALVFTRYAEAKAVVLHPEDFNRLSALDSGLEELSSERLTLSDLAAKAHALEDAPGTPVENPDEIKALLRL